MPSIGTPARAAVFGVPESNGTWRSLSLKEQVDLERFLTAKRHFLKNEARVIELSSHGRALSTLRRVLPSELPEFYGPCAVHNPAHLHAARTQEAARRASTAILWRARVHRQRAG